VTVRMLAAGDRAIVIDLCEDSDRAGGGRTAALELATRITDAGLDGVEDVVPSEHSILLVLSEAAYQRRMATLMATLMADLVRHPASGSGHAAATSVIRIPVTYDGPDLEEVALASGLTPRELVQAHCGTTWAAAFAGFMPGFCYLLGGDPRIQAGRRAEPRPQVPAGSVALAGHYSAVYPRQAPGGWQLIGTTRLPVWDLDAQPPAAIIPGCQVQFVDIHGAGG
jgi:KipI family sensor histidine kinase inhibitor